ncbi:MAG: Uma2 family endonuclease [Chloroflexota bacterium]|nr:Uma2 family endonuclease [Chloroflexota bacterium]
MTLAQVGRITVAEFERLIALPENADRKLELFNGEIIEHMPTVAHARVMRRLHEFLSAYLRDHAIGEYFPELRLSLPDQPDHDVIPDLVFVRQERLAAINDDEAPLPFIPDLCIEIQSPGQSKTLLQDKARYYLAHGARMVWIIYPKKGMVEWLTPTDGDFVVGGEALTGGAVLPGFSVTVSALLTLP